MSRQPAKRARPMRKPVSHTPVWVTPLAVVAGIAVLVGAFLIIRWYTTPVPPPPLNVDATQRVVAAITSIPASELDAIGKGSANNVIKPVSGTPLTGPNGHPEVFYLGAEYCPYCAAERWPMIIALSRFGTFSGLKTTTSSSSDVYPIHRPSHSTARHTPASTSISYLWRVLTATAIHSSRRPRRNRL